MFTKAVISFVGWVTSQDPSTLFLILTFGIFLWLKERQKMMSTLQSHGIRTPPPSLFTGNLRLPEFMNRGNVLFDGHLLNRFGPICGYYLGAKPVIVTAAPDLLEIMQKEEKNKFLDRPRKVPGGINPDKKRKVMLGNLPVEEWVKMRKVLRPAFASHNLSAMLENISSKVDIFMNIMHDKIEANPEMEINLYSHFQLLTLDIIGKTAFGLDSNMQTDKNDELLQSVQAEFSKSISKYLVQVYLCLPGLVPYITPIRESLQRVKSKLGLLSKSALWEMGRSALAARRNLNSSEQVYKDLLSCLTEPKHRLSDDKIVANTVLMFEAAYETTSSCLGFLIHILVNHSEHQEKIQQEIKEVLEGGNSLDSYQGLQNLKYLEACIYEGLRMYPPQTTFIGRSSEVDMDYTSSAGNKYTIPKGVHIQAALVQIHRNGEFWENPDEFIPERFFGKEGQDDLKKFTYQAFGHGPRECIGKGFAIMTLKFILATLLAKYKLVPSESTEESGKISIEYKTATMTPARGSFARLVKI